MASEVEAAPSIATAPLQIGAHTRFLRYFSALEAWLEAERDQLALWLPIGLGAGIAAWFALPTALAWQGVAMMAAAIGLAALLLGRGSRAGQVVGWFAIAMLVGLGIISAKAMWVAAPRIDRPVVATFSGTIEAVQPLPARDIVRLQLAPDPDSRLPPRIRVNADPATLPAYVPVGARIDLRARLMPPMGPPVPGGYDYARVAWFQGIGATGKVLGNPVLHAGDAGGGFWAWLANVRARLSNHIQAQISGTGEGGVAASFATGDQGAIPEENSEVLRRSGLAHLLSVSGLHVSAVVVITALLVLRLLALSPRLALHAPLPMISAGAGALAAIAYTLLAGAEVPTIRSCIAAILVLIGISIGREAMTLRLVAAGALIVLLFWPEALAGPSFQLSFAAVTALIALHEHPRMAAFVAAREEGVAWRVGRNVAGMLISGLVIELALMPIAMFHFHKAGLYGAVANIFAIPLSTFVIMPLEAAALFFDMMEAGAPFWWLTGKALSLLLWIAHVVGDAPGAVAALPSMPWGAFALMVIGGFWIALWRTKARRLGAVPLAFGLVWAVLTLAPDMLVTGDGRHVAVRTTDGRIALLRPKAGDYVRDVLGEASGVQDEPLDFDMLKNARCGPDICAVDLAAEGRNWRIVATRSANFIDIATMNRTCATADIVVSDRRLPRTCHPRWLKLDQPWLAQSGGLAIRLGSGVVDSVAEDVGQHPWAVRLASGRRYFWKFP
ncbi:MAG: competence protein ComEC [Rhizorhabdus sp.]|nr:competence protein ComEC [Rhizorhabdus sp.]